MPTKRIYSIDLARVLLMVCIVLANYGTFVPYLNYAGIVLSFASGTLFTLYGYLVLRDDNDLKGNLLHTLKVFAVFFVIDFILTTGYMYIVYGRPFAYLTKRGIFNFVVLNYWGANFGAHIWYIQALLYALVILYLLKKFNLLNKLAVPLCILCFVVAFVTGEGAGLVHFSFLKNDYIPGNFLTRALPYMLLGKIFRDHRKKFSKISLLGNLAIFFGGAVLSVAEFVMLGYYGKLVYYNHLIGFIPMALGVLIWAVTCYDIGKGIKDTPMLFKVLYYTSNPIAEIIAVLVLLLAKDQETYNIGMMSVPFLTLLFGLLLPIASIKIRRLKDET